MEKVEGPLKDLQLWEKDKRGIKIGWTGSSKAGMMELQALAKLLSEKPMFVEAMAETLGRIWCPIRGLECKEVGKNTFMFTFRQESTKRMALDGGPWEFGGDLLVLEDYVPGKRIEDYSYTIPIWICVLRLPLGLTNKAAGEIIGAEVGEVIDVEAGRDGRAEGNFLRLKVRMNIKAPLMRGFILDEEVEEGDIVKKGNSVQRDEDDKNWCPFEYEYLPGFYYVCGIIGHVDRYVQFAS